MQYSRFSGGCTVGKQKSTTVVCLKDYQNKRKTPTFRLELVELSGIEPLLFVCLKDSRKRKEPTFQSTLGGDKRDRTADLLNAIQALSRLDRLHTPLNRANRAFNTRDTPPKAAKPSAFFLKFIIAGARPHINTKFENKLDTAIPFSHGIISLFHSERGC